MSWEVFVAVTAITALLISLCLWYAFSKDTDSSDE
jgi:hypothetical protein